MKNIALAKGNPVPPSNNITIFPPPGAQEVLFVGYCMNIDIIVVVLLDGTICLYKLDHEANTALLDKRIKHSEILDQANRSLK